MILLNKFVSFLAIITTLNSCAVLRAGSGKLPPVEELKPSRSIDSFAVDIFRELSSSEGNLFLSPQSLHAALSMLAIGARGNTETELKELLHWKGTQSELAQFHKTLGDEQILNKNYALLVANSVWRQVNLNFVPDFLVMLQRCFRSSVNSVDFRKDPDQARKKINEWAKEQTKGRIDGLVQPGTVNSATRLVLVNALYFKAPWQHPFSENLTKKEAFYLGDGSTIFAPMMKQRETLRYFSSEDLQVVELPYRGKGISMVLFLPKKKRGLPELEHRLERDGWDDLLGALRFQNVQLAVPKFEITSLFRLNKPLEAMGLHDVFGAGANFSGMLKDPGFAFSDVIHKAFIRIDEAGTEAAAATAALTFRSSAMGVPPVRFVADHPFLFLIRDVKSGSPLFLGRVNRPE